jgi:O-antigen/teichoic acid export membrane protein
MIFLDFLIYNLTSWYDDHRNNLKWSTPVERASYVVGIITVLWLLIFWFVICVFLNKSKITNITWIVCAILGFGSTLLYRYIYKKRGRYDRIIMSKKKPFNVSGKVGQWFCIGFVFFSMIVLWVLIVNAP